MTPRADEDIDGPCHYSLILPDANKRIEAVWVIFDRGRDVHELAFDPDVVILARRFRVALLLHGHCPGKQVSDRDDMNMNPSQGLGPALQRALDQFAQNSSYPELSKANLIFLGFSGAGPLSARLIGEYSDRTIAGVLSAPGHYRPDGIDTVNLDRAAQQVPQLVVANGADDRSGTRLPYEYFEKYRRLGAPWTFVVQNRSPHCCTANVKALMLDWLTFVLTQRLPKLEGEPLRNIDQQRDWLGLIHTEPAEIKDSFGLATFNVSSAEVISASPSERRNHEDASWLPTQSIAKEWLWFIQQKDHPVLPLN